MKGWITWLAAACTAGLGVVSIVNGNTEMGMQQIIGALAMVGIGRKIEKSLNLLGTESSQSGTELNSVPRDNNIPQDK